MLQEFLKQLNGIQKNIKFTMEIEKNGVLPFLDVLVNKWMDEWHSWAHRKPTHKDIYLHTKPENQWNVVLEKDGKDQLDRSYEKWSIT
jgi:hypothetical protein